MLNLLLVYYKTGCYNGLHVSVNVLTALDKNWLALCLSASKDSAEEAGAGAGLGLEEHLELTPTTFRKHGSFVTALPPRGGPCIIFRSVCGFVCVVSHHCCHFDLQSTTLDQSSTAPLYIRCISANHGSVSSIPGWNHLTMHYLDFWFLIQSHPTSILNLMTSEPAQSPRLWIQHWFSCDSAFLPVSHQFLAFTHIFPVINVCLDSGIDDVSNLVHTCTNFVLGYWSKRSFCMSVNVGNQWSCNNWLHY